MGGDFIGRTGEKLSRVSIQSFWQRPRAQEARVGLESLRSVMEGTVSSAAVRHGIKCSQVNSVRWRGVAVGVGAGGYRKSKFSLEKIKKCDICS